jgi:hypothetical protein
MSKAASAFSWWRSFVNHKRLSLDSAVLFDFGQMWPGDRFRALFVTFPRISEQKQLLGYIFDSLGRRKIAQHVARH